MVRMEHKKAKKQISMPQIGPYVQSDIFLEVEISKKLLLISNRSVTEISDKELRKTLKHHGMMKPLR